MALSLYEWWLMLSAMLFLPVVALSMRLVGFNKTKAFMSYFIPAKSGPEHLDEAKVEKASIIARMVVVAARYGPYRSNCLKRSLVLWWLLARHGILSEIRFGVQKEPDKKIGAHAWVECGGVILSDALETHQRFSVLG